MANIEDIDKFLKRFNKAIAKNANRIERAALLVAEAEIEFRIFNEGKATNGSKIGSYSTKPIYINPNKADIPKPSSVKPKGKNGQVKFKNGKSRKTKYFSDGYKGLRRNQGRQASKVDLQMSGDLFRSIKLGNTPDGANALGIVGKKQGLKADWNEKHFEKTIFTLSNSENKKVNKAIVLEIDKILSRL